MDVMAFLSGKHESYARVFLDVVKAHRRDDVEAVTNGIEVLLGFHVAAQEDPDTMRTFLRQLIENAAADEHITEMAAESYANYGPGATGHE